MDLTASRPFFHYPPLRSANDFRSVHLLPGDGSTDIECQINTVTLDSPPVYSALSYTWGSSERRSPIFLNNQSLHITENLFLALRHLRCKDTVRVLWIDAICINQSDEEEKSAQVRRMRDIYGKAESIIIWLGPEENGSALAMAFVERLSKYRTETEQRLDSDIFNLPTNDLLNLLLGPNARFLSVQSLVRSFDSLLSRPWWFRVWIVQEVTVASNPKVFHCGRSTTSWEDLVFGLRLIQSLRSRADIKDLEDISPTNEVSSRRVFNLDNVRETAQDAHDLLNTLTQFRHFKATDPRDKVYALLSLLREEFLGGLVPDYHLDLRSVYKNAAKHCILARGSLDCLSYCFFSQRNPILPSWTPDWSNQESRHPLAKYTERRARSDRLLPVYHASGTTMADLGESNFLGNKLVLRGLCVDKVKSISTPYSDVEKTCEDRILSSWMPTSPEDIYKPTGQSTYTAFCHTLVADIAKIGNSRKRGFHIDWSRWEHITDFTTPPPHPDRRVEWGSLLFSVVGRRFLWSETGLMGLAPHDGMPGDLICVLLGGQVLYLLRPKGEGYCFVGECYVHGMMDGEALLVGKRGGVELRTFEIE